MIRLALALLLAAGCYPGAGPSDAAPVAPGSTIAPPMALSVVLKSYGAPERFWKWSPRVSWVAGRQECGWTAWPQDGKCLRGVFYTERPDLITIATWDGAGIAQTSFAHELLHWLLFTETGDPNAAHPGNFYDRVNAANAALWDAE